MIFIYPKLMFCMTLEKKHTTWLKVHTTSCDVSLHPTGHILNDIVSDIPATMV